jgi:hypothetical protein
MLLVMISLKWILNTLYSPKGYRGLTFKETRFEFFSVTYIAFDLAMVVRLVTPSDL